MGRKETIMYCFRLNINNPDHLALHKILRDIDDKWRRRGREFLNVSLRRWKEYLKEQVVN